jgi:hypothetical protein
MADNDDEVAGVADAGGGIENWGVGDAGLKDEIVGVHGAIPDPEIPDDLADIHARERTMSIGHVIGADTSLLAPGHIPRANLISLVTAAMDASDFTDNREMDGETVFELDWHLVVKMHCGNDDCAEDHYVPTIIPIVLTAEQMASCIQTMQIAAEKSGIDLSPVPEDEEDATDFARMLTNRYQGKSARDDDV